MRKDILIAYRNHKGEDKNCHSCTAHSQNVSTVTALRTGCLSISPERKSCEMEPKVNITINISVRLTRNLKRQIMNNSTYISGAGDPCYLLKKVAFGPERACKPPRLQVSVAGSLW